jgi:DNA-binding NarL/FixJ family response regulator
MGEYPHRQPSANEPPGARRGSDRGVKILAVDDHRAFREALRDLIAAAPGFVLVGQACSGEEAVRAVERLSPELVLMDVAMPGMGGIAAAREVLRRYPKVVVVLISVDDPALCPGASELGNTVVCARKQDLRPNQLKQVWEIHCN